MAKVEEEEGKWLFNGFSVSEGTFGDNFPYLPKKWKDPIWVKEDYRSVLYGVMTPDNHDTGITPTI